MARFVTLLALLAAVALPGCTRLPNTAALALSERAGFTDCAQGCPDMVVVPAGSFAMGAEGGEEGRPEGPIHQVTIARAFALGKTEVSQGQYALFVEETGYAPTGQCRSFDVASFAMQADPAATFRNPGPGAGGGLAQMPASCITWTDAQAYLAWLSARTGQPYRLPTEAEWEYAARAGSSADYPWGDDLTAGCIYANMLDTAGHDAWFAGHPEVAVGFAECHDGHSGAAPVGSYGANAFGLHDMIGNVWEWTQDCYVAPYSANSPTDGSAYFDPVHCERRAVRGGSWITETFRVRSAWRGRDPVDQVSWIFGFRVARDLPLGPAR